MRVRMARLPLLDRTLLWSACSGLLLACSFPQPDLPFLAWFALVPLLLVMAKRPFASGFMAGFAFFAPLLYWLNIVMTTYGQLNPFFSLVAHLLLVTYLALFCAASTWLSCRFEAVLRLPSIITLPVIWVALEYLRGQLFSGFPWGLLGYSQQSLPWMIQAADLTGVYGVSMLLLLINCAAAGVLRSPLSRGGQLAAIMVVLLLAGHIGYGHWRLASTPDQRSDQLRVALVQGNIDQSIKWNPDQRQKTIDRYRDLSAQAAAGGIDLIIWPEAAAPFYLQDENPLSRQVRAVPRELKKYLLVGGPAYEPEASGRGYRYFNSAYLFSPQGESLGRSDKIHLVPFGEYVPLGWLLGFVDKLVVGVGDFSAGRVRPLSLDGHLLGVLVCYEAIFPELARDYVRQGSDLLVNITNDAWFGRSPASLQLLAMTRFRAIENRIWIARAANTGISALVSPSGGVTLSTPLFETLQVSGQVGLGAQPTVYARTGDLLPQFCLMLLTAWMLVGWWVKRGGPGQG
ncbi:MAG: apolipoprotein N-acyltransferase [Desulfuromonadales bacterium]|nr:apolipoprotein N-acyltransferase [Desulfuromonadales bacterium]